MTTEELLIVAGVALLVIVVLVVVLLLMRARRRKERDRLRSRYGREYDATVDDKGAREGVDDLAHREEERRSLSLREPDEETRSSLRERMAALQYQFVEEPGEVLLETQRVVVDALRARGYPIAEDRDRALRLLSVDHPDQTPPLRTLLSGSYGRDVGSRRELFLEARLALREILQVSYSERDLPRADRPAAAPAAARQPARDRDPGERPARDRDAEPAETRERTVPEPAGGARPAPRSEPGPDTSAGGDTELGHPSPPPSGRR